VYRQQEGRWRLADQVVPAGVLAADSLDFAREIGSALAGDRLMRSRQGVLAGAARAPGGEAIVTGIRLTPDFFNRVDAIVQARVLYGRLDVVSHVELYSFLLPILALVVVLVTGAVVLAQALASQMTQPLQELVGAFDRVAKDDHAPLDPVRVPVRGAREVRRLAASFNDMTERLGMARDALAKAEREAAWRDVARRLAHEIKNPLTPMSLSLHRLQRRADLVPEPDRAAVRDSLAALLQEVEHLTRLAERFSQYASLPELEREPLELGEIARAAVALHEPEGVTLRLEREQPANVSGDRLLLSRALHNLVLNACEASPPGAEVVVRVGADDREGWVEVLDRGPGVSPEVAARVFEPYVSTKNRGSGLGLSLVHDTARKHGGRVTLEDREGGGARARLVLPLSH